jgi:hypothetical protein
MSVEKSGVPHNGGSPKKVPSRPGDPPAAERIAWAANASALALWADSRLVNQRDRYGNYLAPEQRTNKKKAVTRQLKLTREALANHFRGESAGDLLGLHAIACDNTCRWVAVDIDLHGDPDEELHQINRHAALTWVQRLRDLRFRPLLLTSNGRGGYHLLVVITQPVPSEWAFAFVNWVVHDWERLGLASKPETFPKQPGLSDKVRFGNWLRLPGRHHTLNYFSRVWTGQGWAKGEGAIQLILATTGDDPSLIPDTVTPTGEDEQHLRAPVYEDQYIASSIRELGYPMQTVLAGLKQVRPCGDQFSARCPAHADFNNSLSVREADDGTVLVKCHRGCTFEEIALALDLMPCEFFPRRRRRFRSLSRRATP